MKVKAVLLAGVALATIAVGAQDTVKFARAYKVGDADNYKMHAIASLPMGDADVNMTMVQKVLKTYDNGEADVETSIQDFHVSLNGAEHPGPTPEPQTVHVDRRGMPTQMKAGGMSEMQLGRFAGIFYDRELKVGETIPVNYVDPNKPNQKVTGTVRLDSIANGEAKVIEDLTMTTPEATEPMKVNMIVLINTADSKLDNLDAPATHLSAMGMDIPSVKFTMERIK